MKRVKGALLLGCLALAGCNRGPQFAEVTGVVRIKGGQPMANVMVEFLPDSFAGTDGPRSLGVSDEQGRFRLALDDQRPGAVVGKHRVLLRDARPLFSVHLSPKKRDDELERNKNNPAFKSRIPARYSDLAQAMQVEVKAGSQEIDLEVADR